MRTQVQAEAEMEMEMEMEMSMEIGWSFGGEKGMCRKHSTGVLVQYDTGLDG